MKEALPEEYLREFWTKNEDDGDYVLAVVTSVWDYGTKKRVPGCEGVRGDCRYCGPRCQSKPPRLAKVSLGEAKNRRHCHRYWWIHPDTDMQVVAAWPGVPVAKAGSFLNLTKQKTPVVIQASKIDTNLPKGGPCGYIDDEGRTCRRRDGQPLIYEGRPPYQSLDISARRLLRMGYPTTRCVLGGLPHPASTATIFMIKRTESTMEYLRRAAYEMPFETDNKVRGGVCYVFCGLAEDHKWKWLKNYGPRCPVSKRESMQIPNKTHML